MRGKKSITIRLTKRTSYKTTRQAGASLGGNQAGAFAENFGPNQKRTNRPSLRQRAKPAPNKMSRELSFFRAVPDASNKVSQRDLQGGAYSHQGVYRDVFFTALHRAHVRRIKVRLFSKFLLTHSSLLAIGADILAQNASMLGEGTHTYNPNRKRRRRLTDIPAISLLQPRRDGDTPLSRANGLTEPAQGDASTKQRGLDNFTRQAQTVPALKVRGRQPLARLNADIQPKMRTRRSHVGQKKGDERTVSLDGFAVVRARLCAWREMGSSSCADCQIFHTEFARLLDFPSKSNKPILRSPHESVITHQAT